MSTAVKLSVSVLIVILLATGVYDYLKLHENNSCEMTWMYEYPDYRKIKIGKDVDQAFPMYGLYIYGEGSYAQKISKLRLDGIPVLFIPGNAGSYRQVRSLGSVSLRKSENIANRFQFNFFSIDFNEEFSGLYGEVLTDQTEYVAHCIKKILSLYKSSSSPPSSVVIVGHSMGGVIARALFAVKDFDASTVNTIITQATPHQSPVLPIEKSLQDFYNNVNYYWQEHAYTTLDHVTVVSSGGGYRDILVRNGLTSLKDIVRPDRHISTCTMSVPKAFVSTDHLCAVWCRQVVLVTTRSLFDIVDPKTKQITTDPDRRMAVFKHHYITNPGTPFTPELSREITLDANIPWEEKIDTFWQFEQPQVVSSKYLAIPLVEDDENSLLVMANLTYADWICVCTIAQGQNRCKTCTSLSDKVRLLPSTHPNKKILRTLMEDLGEKSSHVVILLKPVKHRVSITVELYNSMQRHLIFTLPGIYDTIISYPVAVMDASAMLHVNNQTVFYSLHLSGMDSPLKAYTALVNPRRCQKKEKEEEGNVLSLNIPWSNETVYTYSSYNKRSELDVKLQSGRPNEFDGGAVHLELYLNPSCSYQLKLKLSTVDTLGQIIRFYGVLFPAAFVAILFMALGYILSVKTGDESVKPQDIVWNSCKPYMVVPVVSVIRVVLSVENIEEITHTLGLPLDDSHSLTDKSIWSPFLSTILYFLAFGTTYFQCTLMYYFIATISKVFSKIFSWVPKSVLSLGVLIQVVLGVTAILISVMVCGTAGLFIIYFLLIIKVLRAYHLSQQSKEDKPQFNFLFMLLLLLLWMMILNFPSMLVWVKNLRYSQRLSIDPSRIPCTVTAITIFIFISININFKSTLNLVFGSIFYLSAIIIMLYGLESIYRIPFIIATMLTVLASYNLRQLISNKTDISIQ
ncbi:hypothetical protein SNE40_019600 [Patella caerulea]|uniref:GPI inositol-deacylase n=1 Tax=Patella caerulea TaxID=87958 RepID=A0AAN8PJ14_PATCE